MTTRNATSNAGFGSFFRYHGWLSPGIRLFRRISFPAKASWISTMFLLPLVILLWLLWSATAEQVNTTQSERQGLTYVSPLVDLIAAAQNNRRAATAKAPDLSETQSKVEAAFSAVAARQKELGTAFATKAGFDALDKSHSAIARAPVRASPDETFAAHTAFIDAALALIGNVADGSQLSLDPELDTYHLMNMSVVLGPQYQEYLARLRGLGNIALQAKETPGSTPQQLQALNKARVLMEYIDASYENSYAIGVKPFPDAVKALDMEHTDSTRQIFLDAVDKQVMIPTPSGDAASFLAVANTAINKQLAMDKIAMGRLDSQLSARIARLQAAFYRNLGVSLIGVFAALYLMLAFYKVMMGGLREVTGHLEQITLGNLITAPTPWGNDEAAHLMITLRDMEASLRVIVRNTLDGAGNVNTASEEIASASQDLSRRTEASAAALEQTAATMTQISETVQRTSDTVAGASEIVRANAAAAERGGKVIGQVVDTMQGINTSSARIADIISVIDGIAFQTNILALNAAVEAARAGEQGRGFAVVASEVRSLAGRSAEAAKEIKQLINASMEQVEKGTQVVGEAGATIREIVGNAARIDTLMAEIANSTREQSLGVAQVGSAVHDLDQNTQQNAALVEETAAAASSLSDQAQRLAQDVGFFKLH